MHRRLLTAGALAAVAAPVGAVRAQATASHVSTAVTASAERWTVSDGVWLRYRIVGNGAPLVLLHGFNDRLETLLPLAQALGRERRVIVLDQRGFGESSKPTGVTEYGVSYVEDVVRLLDDLGIERADVLGHSFGALVAAKLVARHPERVRRLVLAAPVVYRDSIRLVHLLAPTVASLARGGGTLPLARTLAALAPSDAAGRSMDAAALRASDPRALLAAARSFPLLTVQSAEVARVRVPTLGIGGTRDPLADALQGLGGWWPGLVTLQLDGATHDGILTDPRFVARVREFLGRP